jgi:hypothetical protein
MSIILRRPYLIDERSSTVRLPSPTFDTDAKHSDIPSPIVDQIFRCKAAKITMEIAGLKNKTDTMAVSALLQKLHDLHDNLPDTLKLEYSSPSVDKKHPRLLLSRHKVNLDLLISIFMVLKPFMLLDSRALLDSVNNKKEVSRYREMACEYAVRLIEALAHMEQLFIPQQAKDNQITFQPFDIAMTLCVAAQKDLKRTLPLRGEIVKSIGIALRTLSRMAKFSRMAREGSRVLHELVQSLSIAQDEKDVILAESTRQRNDREPRQPEKATMRLTSKLSESLDEALQTPNDEFPAVNISVINEQVALEDGNLESFTQQTLPSEWINDIDLGILDDMFHWDPIFPSELGESSIQQ